MLVEHLHRFDKGALKWSEGGSHAYLVGRLFACSEYADQNYLPPVRKPFNDTPLIELDTDFWRGLADGVFRYSFARFSKQPSEVPVVTGRLAPHAGVALASWLIEQDREPKQPGYPTYLDDREKTLLLLSRRRWDLRGPLAQKIVCLLHPHLDDETVPRDPSKKTR